MKFKGPSLLPVCLIVLTLPAFGGPRDAMAVLNRCGQPLRGDKTVLEDTVSGGRRILSYERGTTIYFEKVAVTGWTFSHGTDRKQNHLNEEQLGQAMPCFRMAMADSLASQPLPKETAASRLGMTMKDHVRQLVLGGFGLIAICGIILFALPRDKQAALYED